MHFYYLLGSIYLLIGGLSTKKPIRRMETGWAHGVALLRAQFFSGQVPFSGQQGFLGQHAFFSAHSVFLGQHAFFSAHSVFLGQHFFLGHSAFFAQHFFTQGVGAAGAGAGSWALTIPQLNATASRVRASFFISFVLSMVW